MYKIKTNLKTMSQKQPFQTIIMTKFHAIKKHLLTALWHSNREVSLSVHTHMYGVDVSDGKLNVFYQVVY